MIITKGVDEFQRKDLNREDKMIQFTSNELDGDHWKYWRPILTPRGLCASINSLPMRQLLRNEEDWLRVFNQEEKLYWKTGGGNLQFALNFYRNTFWNSTIKGFLLSISNEHNAYDIYKQHYTLVPGYSYTFQVAAKQMVTTPAFDAMDPKKRQCRLPAENPDESFFQAYSRSGCELECAVRQVAEDLQG
jgi:hypothetical protein